MTRGFMARVYGISKKRYKKINKFYKLKKGFMEKVYVFFEITKKGYITLSKILFEKG